MEYDVGKREIVLGRSLSELDFFVLDFLKILKKYADYVIISGYISILLGRSRATEDIDLFLEKISFDRFLLLYTELLKNEFWCLNADKPLEVYSYLSEGLAVRFARKNMSIPNFEIKFPKREIDKGTFEDFIVVRLKKGDVKISSLERQIAFKRYYLKSDKDIEDALHIEKVFQEKIDWEKINKLRSIIEDIRN